MPLPCSRPCSVPAARRIVAAGATLAALLGFAATASAATPASGTISESNTSLTYAAGPFAVPNPSGATGEDPVCAPTTCDDYALTVDLPAGYQAAHPNDVVAVRVQWPVLTGRTDFDLYIFDPSGTRVTESATSNDPEVAFVPAVPGTYTVRVVSFLVTGDSFTGTITLGPRPASGLLAGLYVPGTDVFGCNTHLTGAAGLFDHGSDSEPAVKFYPDGRALVTSNGLGGVGLWKVSDGCGKTFQFFGTPDLANGGGDTDIEVAPEVNQFGFHNIYVSSLHGLDALVNINSSTSFDGGATFVTTPLSDITPLNDRNWNAAYGANTVYLSYRSLNTGNQLWVVRSDAAGAPGTFVGPYPVYQDVVVDAAINTQLGVMVTDPRPVPNGTLPLTAGPDGEGNVYHGFVLGANKVYVAVSHTFGVTWASKLVFQGASGQSFDHIFSWVAVDRDGNVYTTFSDNHDVYYAASTDQGEHWSLPVRVSSGAASKTAVLPTMAAGTAGRLVFAWYGTSAPTFDDPAAQWHVFHARTKNALDALPTFEQVRVSDHVVHVGELCQGGTLGCSGNTRALLDDFEIDVDPLEGTSFLCYTDDGLTGGTYISTELAGPSALVGVSVPDRSAVCPRNAASCQGQSQPENVCVTPGLTVVNDPAGDNSALGDARDDILKIQIAEPVFDPPARKLVVTMTLSELDPANLPLSHLWRVYFSTPGDGLRHFVSMATCDVTNSPSFDYGHVDPTTGTNLGDGDADAGVVRPDGTIQITISDALVGNPQPGQVLTGVSGTTRVFLGAQCTGVISQIDGTGSGTYTMVDPALCQGTAVAGPRLSAQVAAGGGVDLLWTPNVASDVTGFNVYRDASGDGGLEKLNAAPIVATGGELRFHDAPLGGGVVFYRLTGLHRDGFEELLATVSVDLSGASQAVQFSVAGPNPFHKSARVTYALPAAARVRLAIFDAAGRLVRNLVDKEQPAGRYTVPFGLQPEREGERELGLGVYLVRFKAGTYEKTVRIIGLDD